jgi:hypothetical protein
MCESKEENRNLPWIADRLITPLISRSAGPGILPVALRRAAVQDEPTSYSTRGRFLAGGALYPELGCMLYVFHCIVSAYRVV